jgi:hypothetical protein
MCRIALIYTPDELKALDKKSRDALQKYAVRLVRTAPQVRAIIAKDPKVQRKLKAMLRPTYAQLKRKRPSRRTRR